MLLCSNSKERAIFCYKKDKERLHKHIKRLLETEKDYLKNKDKYKKYVYNEEVGDYIKNDYYEWLQLDFKRLNFLLDVCGYEKLENIYQMKDNEQIIDYLEYLLERDN